MVFGEGKVRPEKLPGDTEKESWDTHYSIFLGVEGRGEGTNHVCQADTRAICFPNGIATNVYFGKGEFSTATVLKCPYSEPINYIHTHFSPHVDLVFFSPPQVQP